MRTWILAAALLVAISGCGGSSATLEPTDETPHALTLPAFRGVSEEGDELILQYENVNGQLRGAYYYFPANVENPSVLSGDLTGTQNGGNLQIRLLPTFDPSETPIDLEGTVESNGILVHDVETPAETYLLQAVANDAAPAKPVEASRAGNFYVRTLAFSIAGGKEHKVTYGIEAPTTISPLWPYLSTRQSNDTRSRIWLGSWRNGWAWIDIYTNEFLTIHSERLWFRTDNYAALENIPIDTYNLEPESASRGEGGVWFPATGTLSGKWTEIDL